MRRPIPDSELNAMYHFKQRPASIAVLVLSCSLWAITIAGCGGTTPAPPNTTGTGGAETTAAASGQTNSTAPSATTSGDSDIGRTRRQNERWADANGVQYLGNVPLDVFFDQPYAVASDATPLAGVNPATTVALNTGSAGTPSTAETAAVTADTTAADGAADGGDWAEHIPLKTLDEEVTSIRNFMNESLRSVGSFNSSMLMIPPKAATVAALATIAMEHPEEISWKEDARYIRDLAKHMNESDLQRGKKDQDRLLKLFENMQDTLNRSKPAGLAEPPAEDSFADVAEMRLLMMRMGAAEKTMKNEAGTETTFESQKTLVMHEAAILGTMAKVVTASGYGYADDGEFLGYAQRIIDAAKEIRTAAETGSFESYESALGKVATACTECHSAFKNN